MLYICENVTAGGKPFSAQTVTLKNERIPLITNSRQWVVQKSAFIRKKKRKLCIFEINNARKSILRA